MGKLQRIPGVNAPIAVAVKNLVELQFRIGRRITSRFVAFRSAKVAYFRGAKGDTY